MRESVVSLRKFEFLVMPIENSVSAFSLWKKYNVGEINEENRQALFSNAESCVLPVSKRYACIPSISFNLKCSNFFVTTYYRGNYILIVPENLELLTLNESKEVAIWI